jgi:hypothetical protein
MLQAITISEAVRRTAFRARREIMAVPSDKGQPTW